MLNYDDSEAGRIGVKMREFSDDVAWELARGWLGRGLIVACLILKLKKYLNFFIIDIKSLISVYHLEERRESLHCAT